MATSTLKDSQGHLEDLKDLNTSVPRMIKILS
jgi:hypothetical protein